MAVTAPINPMRLSGRHVLVTGAASGIGLATARLLAGLGARLTLVDLDMPALDELSAELAGENGVVALVCDLRRIDMIGPMVQSAVERGGRLHAAVHCAGLQKIVPVRSLRPEHWKDIFAVNTEAALALARCFASRSNYAGRDGALVFISSVIAKVGSPGAVAYAASKAALHGMVRTLALEFAPMGLRVNCVVPGFVRTPLFDRTAQHWDDAQRAAVEDMHPLGFGEPEDVANAIAFLLADTGGWITGTELVVDGGYLAH
jgi:NAD(P)-dependent dehydrogenase (short-subunit alcohol dehydrogenase family)